MCPSVASTEARHRVIRASLSIVEDGGLSALTIDRLVAASGVSNGSIYHHFGSRDGVVASVFIDSFEHCIGALVPALDARPARQVVPELVRRYLDWIATNPVRGRFIYTAAVSSSIRASRHDTSAAKNSMFIPIAEWFAARAARGEIRRLPPWSLDPIVMGPAHECARRFLAGPDGLDLVEARELAASAAWAIVHPSGVDEGPR